MKNRRINKNKYPRRIGDKKPIPLEINRSRNKYSKLDQSLTNANRYIAKPFIKMAGGKTQLLPDIAESLPLDIHKKECYVEPFVGGGSVLFWLLQRFSNFKLVLINDLNSDFIIAYKVIKKSPHKLIKYLKSLEQEYYSIEECRRKQYYENKREIFNSKKGDPIENTGLLIFLNKTCFNGMYRVNSKGDFNVPFVYQSKPPRICHETTIIHNSKILKSVKIINKDFSETLEYADSNSYYYIDPPYKPLSKTASFTSYTIKKFDDAEQIRLAEFCKALNKRKTNWLLSNSDLKNTQPDNNFFDELYRGFKIKRVEARRNINSKGHKRGKISELLISNY
jgi:DNA adenine methylase